MRKSIINIGGVLLILLCATSLFFGLSDVFADDPKGPGEEIPVFEPPTTELEEGIVTSPGSNNTPKQPCNPDRTYQPIGGGWTTGGGGGTNCCAATNVNCPRWICGSGDDFNKAWNNQKGTGYDPGKAAICASDSQVCWFGTPDSVNNHQQIGNRDFNWGRVIGGSSFGLTTGQIYLIMRGIAQEGKGPKGMAFVCDLLLDGKDHTPDEVKVDTTCSAWLSAGDQTHVASGVRNASFPKGYDEWVHVNDSEAGDGLTATEVLGTDYFVWAKPKDRIEFHDCYYSGLQAYYNKLVTYPLAVPQRWHYPYINPDYAHPNTDRQDEPDQKANPLVPFHEAISWKTNGYKVTGPVSGGYVEPVEGAAPRMYNFPNKDSEKTNASYSVDPIEDLGEGALPSNVNEVSSLFHSGDRVIEWHQYAKSWDCNNWEHTEHEYEEKTYSPDQQGQLPQGDGWNCVLVMEADKIHPKEWFCSREYEKPVSGYSTCSIDQESYNPWSIGDPTAVAATYFKVPYNYINEGGASINSEPIYTGETVSISRWVDTLPKSNILTHGTYATVVPNATWVTAMYLSDSSTGQDNQPSDGQCSSSECAIIFKTRSEPLNTDGDTGGKTGQHMETETFNVWDTEAGRYLCVLTMVNPASSLRDDNMTGDANNWGNSNPVCKPIYKKPSFQVRFGGIYIDYGTIKGQEYIATKNNVRNLYAFDPKETDKELGKGNTRNYYSWSDQEISIGHHAELIKMASGAAVNQKIQGFGGINKLLEDSDFITREKQPLTIPTVPTVALDTKVLSGIGTSLNSAFRQNINNMITNSNANFVWRTCNIKNPGYYVKRGKRLVIYCNGTLQIDGSIMAERGSKFTTIDDIPLIVIYATNGINISSKVSTIEGWILTDGKGFINTCSDNNGGTGPGGISLASDDCSKYPLTINGTVATHKIMLNRGYGAQGGKGSTNPAELFNLSTSLYMYLAAKTITTDTKSNVVYARELAPRY